MSETPIRDAFATVRRTFSLVGAEIAWRWAFGAAVWVLIFLACFTWLDALPVTKTDELLLGSGSPPLMGRAIDHIFHGSAAILIRAFALLVPALMVLWAIAASVGRAAILRTLRPELRVRWRTLLAVNFLRAVAALAGVVGVIAAFVVFSRLASPAPPAAPRPNAALGLWFVIMLATGVCWGLVNWFLLPAPVFAVREGRVADALVATGRNFRDYTGKWFWIATAFGLMHLTALVAVSTVGPFVLAVAGAGPRWFSLLTFTAITLVYFAVVDALQVTRIVAHVALAPEVPTVPRPTVIDETNAEPAVAAR
jgi:hypothetical protein